MSRDGAALRLFARAVSALWFHRAERAGEPLPEGPVLLVLNHPNGLLDPLLATALLERPPRFVAKSALWRMLPLRPLLAFFRAIPVQRSQDAEAGADRVQSLASTFSAVHATFARGEAVGIFPEGTSQAGPDLVPLKTGPARMLLSAPVRPALVPAGLVYGDLGVFRHGALLRVGTPIQTADLQGVEPETVLALTARIRAALYPLTVQSADAEARRLALDLAWLLAEGPRPGADLAAFQTRVQALAAWVGTLSATGRAEVQAELERAASWLQEKGLRPDQVGHPYPLDESVRWIPRAFGRAALALLCLPAGVLHWPAWRLVDRLARRPPEDLDLVATTKLLAGALLLPAWSLALLALAAWRFGAAGAWAWAAALPLAILCPPVLDAVAEDRRAVRGWRSRKDPAVPELQVARARLLEAVPGLREQV